MKAFYVVAALFAAVAVASANGKAVEIQEEHPIDWYDCSQKQDGNYLHPSDCTRFISCSGGIASQRDCAICHIDSKRCPTGRLVYNDTQDACLWADETECKTGGGGGGESGEGSGEGSGSGEATTEGNGGGDSGEGSGEGSGENGPKDPEAGGPCNPQECQNTGWCQDYLRCDKETSKWVAEQCGQNLVWNPDGSGKVHGGNCDTWASLTDEREAEYRRDPRCLGCFWKSAGNCSAEYDYQPANQDHRNVLRLSCTAPLVFSEAKETCQRCEDVGCC